MVKKKTVKVKAHTRVIHRRYGSKRPVLEEIRVKAYSRSNPGRRKK